MEQRINLSIDGPGIALFSPGVTGDIPKGEDFLTKEFSQPEDIGGGRHRLLYRKPRGLLPGLPGGLPR